MGLITNGMRLYWPGTAEGSAHALLPGQWNGYRQFEKQLVATDGATTANKTAASPTGFYNNSCYHPPIQDGEASWRPAGTGDLNATGYAARLADIDFTGSGDLDATAGLIVSAILALSGSGNISLSAQGRVSATIAMTGSGDLDATASGLATALLALTGSGDLDAVAMGYANATLEIVVTGTGLSVANVGQAVWSQILESGLSAEDIMRLILAIQAGKSTVTDLGGGSATVTFRDQADTKDRIVASMTGSERTAMTLDPTT